MRMPYALLLVAIPGLALGQITIQESSDLNRGGRNDSIINAKECAGTTPDTVILSWPALAASSSARVLKLWASDTSACPESGAVRYAILDAVAPDTATATASVATLISNTGLSACNARVTLYFCALLYDSGSTTPVSGISANNNMVVDGITPAKPSPPSVSSGDGALNVSWSAVTSAVSYQVFAVASTGPEVSSSEVRNTTSLRLGGLANNTTYQVRVRAFSEGGNPSPDSDTTAGTPQEVDDFWKRYQAAQGREEGGCGSGGAGLLALLALLPLALRRRSP